VHCQCGRTLPVPTMLELKRLPADVADSPHKPQTRWTPLQGGVFVTGTLIAIIALTVAIFLAVTQSRINTEKPQLPTTAQYVDHTHKRTADELWAGWEIFSDPDALPQPRPLPRYLHNRRVARRVQIGVFVAGGFVIAGVALSAASFFLRRSPKRKRRRRPTKT
jgi:hypothetical protein